MKIQIEDIRRIELKPGDKLVLKVSGRVSEEMAVRLRKHLEDFAPGVPVLVLDASVSLEILSEVAA
ncbi:hypothetical protein GOD68_18265 [Sinorhizobium medicae]|nr:hypothetical protein [Sinorhizobium medicae]